MVSLYVVGLIVGLGIGVLAGMFLWNRPLFVKLSQGLVKASQSLVGGLSDMGGGVKEKRRKGRRKSRRGDDDDNNYW